MWFYAIANARILLAFRCRRQYNFCDMRKNDILLPVVFDFSLLYIPSLGRLEMIRLHKSR